MGSPVAALLWERWRRTRWYIALAFAVPLALMALMAPSGSRELGLLGYFVTGGFGLLVFGLLVERYDPKDLDDSFPARQYRLPVATRTLAAVRMAYAVGVFGLYGVVMLGAAHGLDLIEKGLDVQITLLCAAELAFVYMQAISWFRRYTHPLVPALSLGTLAILGALAFALSARLPSATRPALILADRLGRVAPLPVLAGVACAAMAGACCLAGMRAVRLDRSGAWAGSGAAPVARPGRDAPFASAFEAQVWFEWHWRGWLFPVSALLGVAVIVGFGLLAQSWGLWFDNPGVFPNIPALPLAVIDVLFYALPVLGWCAGMLAFAARLRNSASRAPTFLFVRPMDAHTLARSRGRAAARSILTGYGVLVPVVALLLVWAALQGDLGDIAMLLSPQTAPWAAALLVLAVAGASMLAAWALWLLAPLAFAAFMGGLGMAWCVALTAMLAGSRAGFEEPIAAGIFLSLALAVVAAYGVAWRRRIIPTRTVARALGALPLVLLLFAGYLEYLTGGLLSVHWAPAAGLAVVASLLVLAPAAMIPLILTEQRHRR
ncbi:MAG: hypothetical protein JXR94_21485 [Candidatus Hydrogenedentes bacterium]|nr:hypothetical protein [Candidatus Hydrogenedentota bacterium]